MNNKKDTSIHKEWITRNESSQQQDTRGEEETWYVWIEWIGDEDEDEDERVLLITIIRSWPATGVEAKSRGN